MTRGSRDDVGAAGYVCAFLPRGVPPALTPHSFLVVRNRPDSRWLYFPVRAGSRLLTQNAFVSKYLSQYLPKSRIHDAIFLQSCTTKEGDIAALSFKAMAMALREKMCLDQSVPLK